MQGVHLLLKSGSDDIENLEGKGTPFLFPHDMHVQQ